MISDYSDWDWKNQFEMATGMFRFKQFLVMQDEPVFRVGTDGVLLGAWSDIGEVQTVMDIGTGTGLLALMIAQRSDARITAVDIDDASFKQAGINFDASPWNDRLSLHHCPIQDFHQALDFDMVICNPPFFQDSKLPDDKYLTLSKHNTRLGLIELADLVPGLLNENGRFCTVFPVEEGEKISGLLEARGMYVHRSLKIRPTPGLDVKRLLLDFRFGRGRDPIVEELVIELEKRHEYSKEYMDLTRDFYLAF